MWMLLLITLLFVVGIPALLLLLWRGSFLFKKRHGEDLGGRLWAFTGRLLPIWGIFVLFLVDQIITLSPVSWDFRLFWHGFLAASDLFLTGCALLSLRSYVQQAREKRQEQPSGNASATGM